MFYKSVSWIPFAVTAIITILAVTSKKRSSNDKGLAKKADVLLGYAGRYRYGLLLILFAVFAFTRLYHLASLPVGLHVDELGMAYDAYSLSHYGMDRHHVSYPVYLENYGGGQSALYAYLAALLLKVFPYSVTIIRLPAVICGMLCFFASYFLTKDVIGDTDKKWIYLLGPMLVTVTPFFMMSERWGLDCNLFLSMATVSLCLLGRAINVKKRIIFFAAGLSFGITLYTYALSYITIPLFVVFVSVYLILIRKDRETLINLVIFVIPIIVLGIPLLVFQMVNMGLISEFDIGPVQFRRLTYYRSGELQLSNVLSNLTVPFKCMYGSDGLSYNAFEEFGPIYLCVVPPLILGIYGTIRDTVKSIKERRVNTVILIPAYFFAAYISLLLPYNPGYSVSNYIFISFVVFSVYGIYMICGKSETGAITIIMCICVCFIIFTDFYFLRQNGVYGYHTLFDSTKPGDIIRYAEDNYDPLHEKKLYVCMNYEEKNGMDIYAGLYGEVPAYIWEPDKTDLGDIYLNLPDEYDPNEEAVYIVGDTWSGVISALIAEGFTDDILFGEEHILHR